MNRKQLIARAEELYKEAMDLRKESDDNEIEFRKLSSRGDTDGMERNVDRLREIAVRMKEIADEMRDIKLRLRSMRENLNNIDFITPYE